MWDVISHTRRPASLAASRHAAKEGPCGRFRTRRRPWSQAQRDRPPEAGSASSRTSMFSPRRATTTSTCCGGCGDRPRWLPRLGGGRSRSALPAGARTAGGRRRHTRPLGIACTVRRTPAGARTADRGDSRGARVEIARWPRRRYRRSLLRLRDGSRAPRCRDRRGVDRGRGSERRHVAARTGGRRAGASYDRMARRPPRVPVGVGLFRIRRDDGEHRRAGRRPALRSGRNTASM